MAASHQALVRAILIVAQNLAKLNRAQLNPLFSLQYFPSLGKRAKICWCSALIPKLWQFFFPLFTQKVNVPVSYASLERWITVSYLDCKAVYLKHVLVRSLIQEMFWIWNSLFKFISHLDKWNSCLCIYTLALNLFIF